MASLKRKREEEPSADASSTGAELDEKQEVFTRPSEVHSFGRVKKAKTADNGGGGVGDDTFEATTAPNASSSSSSSSSFGARMLRKMGYSGDGALRPGGLSEPVASSKQIGRMGIGFASLFQRQTHIYETSSIDPDIQPVWLTNSKQQVPTDFSGWMAVDDASYAISHERFCDTKLQDELVKCKHAFDNLSPGVYRSARNKANAMERVKSEWFMNRAAMKMVELDKLCGRLFTQPDAHNTCAEPPKQRQLLYFADLCGGPGGFTEFMFSKKKWRAKQFGFTRTGQLDWNPGKFNDNAPTTGFSPYYGKKGTGDITDVANIRGFGMEVDEGTPDARGVDVVLADGGFGVSGKERYQELLSAKLVLAQFTVALRVLRKGGHFMCKVFDTFLPCTVDALYLLYLHFDSFSILKPHQSRPANSERYVVCKGLKQRNPPVIEHMLSCLGKMNSLGMDIPAPLLIVTAEVAAMETAAKSVFVPSEQVHAPSQPNSTSFSKPASASSSFQTKQEEKKNKEEASVVEIDGEGDGGAEQHVVGLVPMDGVDPVFVDYMRAVNSHLCTVQIGALKRIIQYVEDPSLRVDDQSEIRSRCLDFWEFEPRGYGPRASSSSSKNNSDDKKKKVRPYLKYRPNFGRLMFTANERNIFASREAEKLFELALGHLRSEKIIPSSSSSSSSSSSRLSPPPKNRLQCFVVPKGCVRLVLISRGNGYVAVSDNSGSISQFGSKLNLPSDTMLDVAYDTRTRRIYVLDAWILVDELDFHSYRTNRDDRSELLKMLVEVTRETRLIAVMPVSARDVLNGDVLASVGVEEQVHLNAGTGPDSDRTTSYVFTPVSDTPVLLKDVLECHVEPAARRE